MNILLLSNGAPGYYRFFNNLIKKCSKDGHEISIAVDSNFSRDENKLNKLGFPIYEFSSFFAAHQINNNILRRYSKYNLNSALLSDFERAEVYNIWGGRDIVFFEKLKSALLSFFEEIIQNRNISDVIYENVSNTFAHFALFVCQENGVTYRGIGGSRLPGRFTVTSDPLNDHQEIEHMTAQIQAGEILVDQNVRDWCEDYLNNIESITPDYMKFNNLDNLSLLNKYFKLEKVNKLLLAIKHLADDSYHSFQRGNSLNYLWQMFKRSLSRRLKAGIVGRFYQPAKEGEKFLLYPLHFHPESSTSILSGTYLNEFEVVRNIAFNLPQGVMLYVKDHISAHAYPSLDFYKKISTLPNVRLLAPTAPTKQLIKASEAVITLTSTVGYEALLLNKRVFLFGHVFYKFHPNVVRVEDPTALFSLFNKELGRSAIADRNYNLNFLAGYYLSTKPGVLNLMQTEIKATELVRDVYFSAIG